ncbi:MAG: glutamine synthetase beta-grasp domain-containing protein [Candidatus Aminicenantes bacterium]|nr:glutamine synthetase beta-grasp domain-containing protein [Candidatus Aminicenantes bacterium]
MPQKTKIKVIQKKCSELNIEFFSLQTLDLKGKIHSLTLPFHMFKEELLDQGVGFDAYSYGFAKAERSDMIMLPDLDTMYVDPFSQKKTVNFLTKIFLTDHKNTRFPQDVRFIAEKAEKSLKALKIGTAVMMAPEYEFFIFKSAEYGVEENGCYYFVERETDEKKNFYHSASPDDWYVDFKNQAVSILKDIGIDIKYHHHEVAVNQHEIETNFNTLMNTSDEAVKIKYILFNLAKKYEIFVTFMPKVFYGRAGNGWHVHQYILKGDKNIFLDREKFANFSKKGLNYLSGLLFHSSSMCAFTNPSTNSYKRLVRGYEAPVAAIFGQSNRKAAIRIPTYTTPEETRLEYRAGDAASNPYLALSSMVMAGIDGIRKNIDPEEYNFGPFDSGIPESRALRKKIRMLPENLGGALKSLEKDNEYLKYDNVFNEQIISRWIELKTDEIEEISSIPHPKEFEQYFNF